MIYKGEISCPVCSGELKYYDHVHRIVKGKEGNKRTIEIRRIPYSIDTADYVGIENEAYTQRTMGNKF